MSNSRNSQISEGTQKCEFSVQIGTKKIRRLSRTNTGFILKIYRFNRTVVISHIFEMPAAFMVRDKHPLLSKKLVTLKDIRDYPVCSTPLSDEVTRILTNRYGPLANPDDMVTLRSDETEHIIEVGRHTDAVVLTIRAAASDLVSLPIRPALNATAKFGLVTLNRRQAAPGMVILHQWLPTWVQELQLTQ